MEAKYGWKEWALFPFLPIDKVEKLTPPILSRDTFKQNSKFCIMGKAESGVFAVLLLRMEATPLKGFSFR